jgi:AcrR family transcriptional regulator
MGRKPGVTAAETRAQLLESAAKVFAEQGYAGARVSEIARDAGLTTGAIYAHYATKADLLCDALRAHGGANLLTALAEPGQPLGSILDVMRQVGLQMHRRPAEDGALVIEAAVAARRDPEVARALRDNVQQHEALMIGLLRRAQEAGEIDPDLPAAAAARYGLTMAMGSLVIRALDLDATEPGDWSEVIDRLIDAMRPPT